MIHPFGMVSSVAETNYCTLKTVLYICQIQNNDTPVQSQSERDKTVAGKEGGSVRTTAGAQLLWVSMKLIIWQFPLIFRDVEDK